MRTPAGNSAVRSAATRFTRSATATVLAPDCFSTFKATAGSPSTKARVRCSSTPSWMRAKSFRRMGRPSRQATTISGYSQTSFGLPEIRTGIS